MPNPIFDPMPQQPTQQGNDIFSIMDQVRSAPNPNEAMQQLMMTNPQVQGVMQLIQQNGGDAKTAFYNLAAQKGVNPNPIIQRLRSLPWPRA